MSNATPMDASRRRTNYHGGALTPRQRRRWNHKRNRELKRMALAESKAAGR